ncbi:MAG: hypothetical protein M1834_005180 [Cirrosporium novae-zelandiae]|nr:MAG: hypothetical protein M1834_005180 [Cirrosporium novae-zelandiae]
MADAYTPIPNWQFTLYIIVAIFSCSAIAALLIWQTYRFILYIFCCPSTTLEHQPSDLDSLDTFRQAYMAYLYLQDHLHSINPINDRRKVKNDLDRASTLLHLLRDIFVEGTCLSLTLLSPSQKSDREESYDQFLAHGTLLPIRSFTFQSYRSAITSTIFQLNQIIFDDVFRTLQMRQISQSGWWKLRSDNLNAPVEQLTEDMMEVQPVWRLRKAVDVQEDALIMVDYKC